MAQLNAAEKMLNGKRRLIKRLRQEIKDVEFQAAADIQAVESRIRIAQTLVDALEKGTLKP